MKNITVSRDKVEQWLEDLEYSNSDKNVITAIKQALAAPVQEPVAWDKPTDEMVQAATDEYDEWAVDNKGTTECIRAMLVKALKATPPAAQPAPVQEPVAWRWTNGKGWLTYGEMQHDRFESTPLYTTPPAAQPSEQEGTHDHHAHKNMA
jgi:hypothetical protein